MAGIRLSDRVHAQIVTAWLNGQPWKTVYAQTGLAANHADAVRAFYALVARRGGWWAPVWCRTCDQCEGPLVAVSSGQLRHSGACQLTWAAADKRRRRALRLDPPSTANVRRWRKQHPDRDLAHRIGETFRRRPTITPPTPAQRAAHSRATIASRQRVARSLPPPIRLGTPWSQQDDTWLVQHQDWSSTAAAVELGRTVPAVLGRRRTLRALGQLPRRGREPVEGPPG